LEKNQEKILTVVAMQIEEARRIKHCTMPLAVDEAKDEAENLPVI